LEYRELQTANNGFLPSELSKYHERLSSGVEDIKQQFTVPEAYNIVMSLVFGKMFLDGDKKYYLGQNTVGTILIRL
jgi:hypothetical protein